MYRFATSHCRPAFPIFRTLTGSSVRALTIPQEASAPMPVCAAGRTVISEVRISRRRVEIDDAARAKGSTGTRSPRTSRAHVREENTMLKPALLIGAGIVVGAGAIQGLHAASGPMVLTTYEANIKDEA